MSKIEAGQAQQGTTRTPILSERKLNGLLQYQNTNQPLTLIRLNEQ